MIPAYLSGGSANASGTASTTSVATFSSDNAAGSLLTLVASWDSGSTADAISSVTDTQGNTWNLVGPSGGVRDTVNAESAQIAYALNANPGPNTVTVTFTSARAWRSLTIAEYSGVDTVNALDGAAQTTGLFTTATDNVASPSITTTANGDLIIGLVVDTDSTNSPAAGTGFTGRPSAAEGRIEDLVQSAAGPISATFTQSPSGRVCVFVAAFKAAPDPVYGQILLESGVPLFLESGVPAQHG